jgi:small subunit ribosomal protein S8
VSMHDPVADMLTRVRNAQHYKHKSVSFPSSKLKQQILRVLKEEGYINDYLVTEIDGHPQITVELKYYQGRPVIERIKRVSRPGLRIYRDAKNLPKVSGFGVAILTTSQGVMTHQSARAKGIGGEVICEVA